MASAITETDNNDLMCCLGVVGTRRAGYNVFSMFLDAFAYYCFFWPLVRPQCGFDGVEGWNSQDLENA